MSDCSLLPANDGEKRYQLVHAIEKAIGYRCPIQTCHRWVVQGVCGGKVRLEAVRIGNRFITSTEAVLRFIAAREAIETASPVPTPPMKERSKEKKAKAIAAAEEKLIKEGC